MVSQPTNAGFRSALETSIRRREVARPLLSVVVPVFNEDACLLALYERLTDVLDDLDDDYELLFIDDGSQDRSLEIVQGLQERDPRVVFRSFTRNFGHEAATTCGLRAAQGQCIVLIDADLQDPPELIPEMLARWHEGYDVVHAQRRSRIGENVFTKATSHVFYRLFTRVAEVQMPVDTGDYRLMDRVVVDAFIRLRERSRFVRGLMSWTGFRQTAVLYDRDPRAAGRTKYSFARRLRLAFDAICGMSTRPLRLLTILGVGATGLSLLLLLTALAYVLRVGLDHAGTVLLGVGLCFFSSVQLAALGLLGEYIGRVYTEVQRRPLYLLRDTNDARPCAQVAGADPCADRHAA